MLKNLVYGDLSMFGLDGVQLSISGDKVVVKTVDNSRLPRVFFTNSIGAFLVAVYNRTFYALAVHIFSMRLFTSFCAQFFSVFCRFIQRFHSTNKNYDKINLYLITFINLRSLGI